MKNTIEYAFHLGINGVLIPFRTLNQASSIVAWYREKFLAEGMGARELGCQFPIWDNKDKEVAHVSYNGIVWDGGRKSPGQQLFPVVTKELCAS